MKNYYPLFPHAVLNAVLLVALSYAQTDEWTNFTSSNNVRAIAQADTLLWLGTDGGLVKYNMITGKKGLFTCTNSKLPWNVITCLAVDTGKSLWIGTNGKGLVRYNGQNWQHFTSQNSGLCYDYVLSLAIDSSGRLLVGTRNGISLFKDGQWSSGNALPLPNKAITSIFVDKNGIIWLGTQNGLASLKNDSCTVYAETVDPWVHATFNGCTIYGIASGVTSKLWLATQKGLVTFDGNAFNFNPVNSTFLTKTIGCILISSDTVYAGTSGKLARIVGTQYEMITVKDTDTSVAAVYSMVRATDGALWIGTNKGLFRYNGGNFQQINSSFSGLLSNSIYELFVDDHDNLYTQGMVYDGSTWNSLNSLYPGISAFTAISLNDMVQDHKGNLWIATFQNGLIRCGRNGTFTVFDTSNSAIPSNHVESVALDSNDAIWGTAYFKSLFMFDGNRWVVYDTGGGGIGMTFNNIYKIVFSNTNDLWMGFFSCPCLGRYDGKNWYYYTTANPKFPGAIAGDMTVTKDGYVMAVDLNQTGIMMFNGDSGIMLNNKNSGLPDNWTYTIECDHKGAVWIGSRGGLSKLENGAWMTYTMSNSPLPDNWVTAIAFDSKDNAWIGTDYGGLVYFKKGTAAGTSSFHSVQKKDKVVTMKKVGSVVRLSPARDGTPKTITITDVSGREVQVYRQCVTTVCWDVSKISAGAYFVTVHEGRSSTAYKVAFVK